MTVPLRPFRISVVGVGSIGSSLLPLVAAMRPALLRIMDGDTVENGNLSRQPLYGINDIGAFKVHVAAERLRVIAPDMEIEAIPHFLDERNAHKLLEVSEIIVDCTDDRPVRLLIDRVCSELGIPLVSGSVHRDQIQVMSLHVAREGFSTGASLRSFFPHRTAEEQDGCSMQDVPAHVTSLAASVMAMRIRAILDGDRSLADTLDLIDARNAGWMRIAAPAPDDGELIAAHKDLTVGA